MAAPRAEALPPLLVADDEDRELAIMERAILAALVNAEIAAMIEPTASDADRAALPTPVRPVIRRLVVFVACARKLA